MRKLLATASILALCAGPALAQDSNSPPSPTPPAPAERMETPDTMTTPAPAPDTTPDVTLTPPSADSGDVADTTPDLDVAKPDMDLAATSGDWRLSKLMGQSIRNGANESIGDINDFLVDSSGKVTAVVVGVGGFLGMGEKNVALGFDQLSISRDANNSLVIMANATKESLQSAPQWTDPTLKVKE